MDPLRRSRALQGGVSAQPLFCPAGCCTGRRSGEAVIDFTSVAPASGMEKIVTCVSEIENWLVFVISLYSYLS